MASRSELERLRADLQQAIGEFDEARKYFGFWTTPGRCDPGSPQWENAQARYRIAKDKYELARDQLAMLQSEAGPPTGKAFLSHAAFDAEIASFLKSELEARVTGLSIFRSSDPTDLPPGVRWPAEIQKALGDAPAFLLLATSRSLARPWVWFESGTVWFRKIPIIPLCLGQIRKTNLPTPLSELQALNLDEPSDLSVLLESLGKGINVRPVIEGIETFTSSLAELETKVRAKAQGAPAGWLGADWNNRFLAYDGPLEGLRLIEDEVYQESMREALEKAGYRVGLGNPEKLAHHYSEGSRIVYLTDRSSWRRKVVDNALVLLARPT